MHVSFHIYEVEDYAFKLDKKWDFMPDFGMLFLYNWSH